MNRRAFLQAVIAVPLATQISWKPRTVTEIITSKGANLIIGCDCAGCVESQSNTWIWREYGGVSYWERIDSGPTVTCASRYYHFQPEGT